MHKYIIVVEKEARDFHAHITIYIYEKRILALVLLIGSEKSHPGATNK
jgi:hypothetical protein